MRRRIRRADVEAAVRRRIRRARPLGAVILGGALALGHAGGCERVTYYSITGSSSSGGPPPPTGLGGGEPGGVTRADVLGAVGACAAVLYRDFAAAARPRTLISAVASKLAPSYAFAASVCSTRHRLTSGHE